MKTQNNKHTILAIWESEKLKILEKKCRDKLSDQYSDAELGHRIAWEMMKDLGKQNFSKEIPIFMRGLPDAQLEMLPIICKSNTFVDSDRFIALINLESQRRSNNAMRMLTEKLNFLTKVLVGLTIVLVLIGILQIIYLIL